MIAKIRGTLGETEISSGIIDTPSGLSYRVFLTDRFLAQAQIDSEVSLYTYHHVREDTELLFGFEDKKEFRIFEYLLTVPGVGPKSAFHIISVAKPDEIVNAVKSSDRSFFSGVKGLGKKTALKIILELSQKFNVDFIYEPDAPVSTDDRIVLDALETLGFDKKSSRETLSRIENGLSVEDKIKKCIALLSTQ